MILLGTRSTRTQPIDWFLHSADRSSPVPTGTGSHDDAVLRVADKGRPATEFCARFDREESALRNDHRWTIL